MLPILSGYELIGDEAIVCDGTFWNGTKPACHLPNVPPATACDFEPRNSEDLEYDPWPLNDVCGFSRRSNLEETDDGSEINWILWNE